MKTILDKLSHLTNEQRNQILRQIQYHISTQPYERVELTNYLILKFAILSGVTRPMSSKGIAKWLWMNSELFVDKKVLDIGTGCGIQGITCKLGGASQVVMTDVIEQAVKCSLKNAKNILPNVEGINAISSDLFNAIEKNETFDLIIFAQPYFPGKPIEHYEFTKGMFDTFGLQNRFFQDAKKFLNEDGKIVMMGWDFVGEENSPSVIAKSYGYNMEKTESYFDWRGVQQGTFDVFVFSS